MSEPSFEFLFQIKIELSSSIELGQTPYGQLRRVDTFAEGRFEGPKLSGTLVAGGNDLRLTRIDGAFYPDVRALLHTDDDHYIQMTYEGIRYGSDEVWARVEGGEEVDTSEYYFRIAARFETSSKKYEWINRILAFGNGVRLESGPVYDIYRLL